MPKELLERDIYFLPEEDPHSWCDPAKVMFLPRDMVEEDPTYKQLVAYTVVVCSEGIFHYRRTKEEGEKRLLGNATVGIGGHVSLIDALLVNGELHTHCLISNAAKRELREEARLYNGQYDLTPWALIYSNLSAVNRVHLGIVNIAKIHSLEEDDDGLYRILDRSVMDLDLCKVEDLHKLKNTESWTSIVIGGIGLNPCAFK